MCVSTWTCKDLQGTINYHLDLELQDRNFCNLKIDIFQQTHCKTSSTTDLIWPGEASDINWCHLHRQHMPPPPPPTATTKQKKQQQTTNNKQTNNKQTTTMVHLQTHCFLPQTNRVWNELQSLSKSEHRAEGVSPWHYLIYHPYKDGWWGGIPNKRDHKTTFKFQ